MWTKKNLGLESPYSRTIEHEMNTLMNWNHYMEHLDLKTLKHEIREILVLSSESFRDKTLTMIGGEIPDVVVQIKGSKVTISIYSAHSDAEDYLEVCPLPIASLIWRRIPKQELIGTLTSMIATARHIRQSNHQMCRYCEVTVAPEFMYDEEACLNCACKVLGKPTKVTERRCFKVFRGGF